MSSIIFPTEKQVLDYALDKSLLLNDPDRDFTIDVAAANAKAAIERFVKILQKNRISVTVRKEMGKDIDAACGQLRAKFAKEQEQK